MRTAAPRDEQNHDTLLPNAGGFAAALALAALIAPWPWQIAAAQAVPCTAIESNEERLACYDRALRSASPAPTSQAPAAAPAQTPNAQPPAASAAESAGAAAVGPSSSASSESSVLGEQPPRNVRESAAPSAPAAPEAAAAGRNNDDKDRIVPIVIVGVRALPGRETTFTAEDGGIWIQTDSQRIVGLPEPPFEAEIRPGAIGSSFLVPKERGRAVRVRSATR
jgi:hypothetical protein